MRAFILAKNDPRAPTKSALLVGPENDDEKVRRLFFEHRAESVHPDGWPVLELHGERGAEVVSVARWKTKEDKAKAMKADADKAKAEADSVAKIAADAEAKRKAEKK
jgi:hypothetical protein